VPKRTDLKKILVLGSGGIVIGQACEFDYSGTQAVRALRAEGYEVVLVNSNPATIMTDPELADRTYIEPLTVSCLRKILAKERPCALLPTVGGQTALNLAMELAEQGVLAEFEVELLGASVQAIQLAEDRQQFRQVVLQAGLDVPASVTVTSVEEAVAFARQAGYPLIVRPSFTLGGSGGGFAADEAELRDVCASGLAESPVNQVLVEESISGWKEFELEVVRDKADNFVVVCTIENLDPMGVHTGDSITVAPAMTLTDPEYQKMRNWSRQIMNLVGVETGGSNVQFAVNPVDGRLIVIEMNPRVSRSSALASKATGFPIAKVAARLAVGYTLDELRNEITGTTPCSFEPALDYMVVKIPRWDFAKFPGAEHKLGPTMKSVGEVMAIGRSFLEALQKGFRSLETGRDGLPSDSGDLSEHDEQALTDALSPTPDRLTVVMQLLRSSLTQAATEAEEGGGESPRVPLEMLEKLYRLTRIDPWFLDQLAQMAEWEVRVTGPWSPQLLRGAKAAGFSDARLAKLSGRSEAEVARQREEWGITPCFQRVDTCAAEFEARTPYLYSSYRATVDEAEVSERDKVIILGSGPNRIGQGIEFDYCCVHASLALREAEIESIMINCNPETVSTDYDTSDRLYFEPLTFEDVMAIIATESARGRLLGVVVQLGGQTPLKLASRLAEAGVPILGGGVEAIERSEDREQFQALLNDLELRQPKGALAADLGQAQTLAQELGYPVLLRPSYVLGGRAMAIVHDESSLERFVAEALDVSEHRPVLIDKFLEDAVEVDVDCLGDGENVVIAGILQHIEEAGVHSGDSACVIPPYKVSMYHVTMIREAAIKLGKALGLRGLMNVQFAICDDLVYIIEVNPRASRTVPFLAKATGKPLARLATHLMLGRSLAEVGLREDPTVDGFFVKEALVPFRKFPGTDTLLGPEMRSTGEVMGQDKSFGNAFAKSQMSAGWALPTSGVALFTVNDFDKGSMLLVARDLARMGFSLVATAGTADFFERAGQTVRRVAKVGEEGSTLLEEILGRGFDLVVNIPGEGASYEDGGLIRRAVIESNIPLITTTSAAQAAVSGIRALREESWGVRAVQDWMPRVAAGV
jgi:carbamoyl-phosphate synthase large subunit